MRAIEDDENSPTISLRTTTEYKGDGQVFRVQQPDGSFVLHDYDAFGRLQLQRRCEMENCESGLNIQTSFEHDAASLVTRTYSPEVADTVVMGHSAPWATATRAASPALAAIRSRLTRNVSPPLRSWR